MVLLNRCRGPAAAAAAAAAATGSEPFTIGVSRHGGGADHAVGDGMIGRITLPISMDELCCDGWSRACIAGLLTRCAGWPTEIALS